MATILELQGDDVKLDMNHPMAGKTLNFNIEVLDISEGTDDSADGTAE